MGMKVCKLVRLTTKDDKGNFVNSKEGRVTIRKRAIIAQESVVETEENYKNTGLLYIVDEKATAERDELVDKEVQESRKPALDDVDTPTLAELAAAKEIADKKAEKEAADKKAADDAVKAAKTADKTPPAGTL